VVVRFDGSIVARGDARAKVRTARPDMPLRLVAMGRHRRDAAVMRP
jgi:hypothetical protein